MHEELPVVDIDRHVLEPLAMWLDYLPAHSRNLAPQLRPLIPANAGWSERLRRLGEHALLGTPNVLCVGDRPIWADLPDVAHVELALAASRRRAELDAGASPGGHLAEMDQRGIGQAVILPTYASYLVYDDGIGAEASRTYAQAYNRFMVDFSSADPHRLCAPILLSRHEPSTMVDDLEQAWRARLAPVVLRPNPVGGRTLSDPNLDRFWSACAAASVPVLLHEGTHARVPTAGRDRFTTRFGKHACSHPIEMMMALLSLIEGGVLQRHPTLRVGFLEAGCGWLPHWLWRLDAIEYRHLRTEVGQHVTMPPSEYFRRQCWIAMEPDEPLVEGAMEAIGCERVVVGSDFPHLDHDGDPLGAIQRRFGALDGSGPAGRILRRNPRELLGAAVRSSPLQSLPESKAARTSSVLA